MSAADGRAPDRRAFLGLTGLTGLAVGGAVTGALSGCSGAQQPAPSASTSSSARAPAAGAAVAAAGRHQAGVVVPQPPQPNLLLMVYNLSKHADPAALLRRLGRTIEQLTGGQDDRLLGLSPGDLTVTVGVGPRLVAAVDRTLPGAEAMPRFGRHERLQAVGGDVAVQMCASDPLVLSAAAAAVQDVGASAWTQSWHQSAFRAQNVPVQAGVTAPRNLLGFVDGIVGPRTEAELEDDVWLSGPSRTARGTIMAVRRMTVDVARFAALTVAEQEQVFGRTRQDARPLTGGGIATDPDLGAKTPAGAYVIPADAHLRRANPASAGVPPMLRRSYSFDGGLLFLSFQSELHTFTATLTRMTAMDALLAYTVTTHAAAFLVLPGFDHRAPLGATLFGR